MGQWAAFFSVSRVSRCDRRALPNIFANRQLLRSLDQFNVDVRRERPEFGLAGKLHADDGFARTRIAGDPNRAVLEHASAALAQERCLSHFFPLRVVVDERCLQRFTLRHDVLLKCPEAARPRAALPHKEAEVVAMVRSTNGQLAVQPGLKAEGALAIFAHKTGALAGLSANFK